jgi:hypothetical protein
MFVSDRVQRPLHPRRERGVKLIVAMCGIGKDYAGAAVSPFDLGQVWFFPLS